MTRLHPAKFGQLLTEGIHRIRLREAKSIAIIQDELAYSLGRAHGSVIEYWRKGHLPSKGTDLETLAREITRRGKLEQAWLRQLLESAGYKDSEQLCRELFGATTSPSPQIAESTSFAPFVVGPPILHPRQFFGRTIEIKRLFNLWSHLPMQNVALIGPKRSGKTSLLHYLKTITRTPSSELRADQRRDWLPQGEQFQWVFIDFQDTRFWKEQTLLRYILTSLNMPVPTPCDLHQFMDIFVQHIHSPTLILMDEIGAALESPELDQRFWWSMRSLGSHSSDGNLGFVVAGGDMPGRLAEVQNKPSPFFNIFGHSFILGPLQEEEARQLIESSPEPFSQADIAWILAQSKRWPYLLQILCHTRLTALQEERSDADWKTDGLRQIAPLGWLLESQ